MQNASQPVRVHGRNEILKKKKKKGKQNITQ